MHRSRSFLTFAGAVSALATLSACSPDAPNPVAPSASAAKAATASQSADGRYILASNSGFPNDLAAQVSKLGGSVERVHSAAGIAVVTGISDANAAKLSAIKGVSEVQPDMIVSLAVPVSAAEADASATQDVASSTANPTLASRYNWQWNMRVIGADKAWAAGKLGSSSVTVAILDTGIDYDAPDLLGLVDLRRSTSMIPADDSITATYFPSRNVISDYHGHGTNVATQVSSNARALAGVTSKTTLIGVKVLSGRGSGPFSAIMNGVLWAADHGANVANMSLGGSFAKASNGRFVGIINKTFNYAARKGMLVVVAAGNEGADLDHDGNTQVDYCSAPQVICVSSVGPATAADFLSIGGTPTTGASAPAFYTNYGRSAISVAAPGGNGSVIDAAGDLAVSAWPWGNDIASWVWSYCSKTRLVFDNKGAILGYAGCQAGNRLTGYIGTSQATPHVAGLAALIEAEKGISSPAQVKAAIEQSAVDLGQAGTDPYYGKGRISVSNALGL